MWQHYFVPNMSDIINQIYIDVGGEPFVIRNPTRNISLYKYSEEVRLWHGKAYRMVYLMSHVEFLPMVLK